MADAIPVHPTKPEPAPKKPSQKKDDASPKEVPHHMPAKPGQKYKLPDGTIVEDN